MIEPQGYVDPSTAIGRRGATEVVRDYVALTKPRIVLLLAFTALAGMVLAARGLPPLSLTVLTLLGLALSAGGANAVNMWYDRDIDPLMDRTASRPIPSGRVRAEDARNYGIVLEGLSLVVLGLFVGRQAAIFSFAGFVYYVAIYTMWLKRRTPQNIVIGGGAGAFPPLVGWAAVSGHADVAAWLLFAIVFLWTPPHFWSLALFRNPDYERARIPMMPAARGEWITKWQGLVYTLLLLGASILLYFTGVVGTAYLISALVLGVVFVIYGVKLMNERLPSVRWAKGTFRFSLAYLTLLFAVMMLNVRH